MEPEPVILTDTRIISTTFLIKGSNGKHASEKVTDNSSQQSTVQKPLSALHGDQRVMASVSQWRQS